MTDQTLLNRRPQHGIRHSTGGHVGSVTVELYYYPSCHSIVDVAEPKDGGHE